MRRSANARDSPRLEAVTGLRERFKAWMVNELSTQAGLHRDLAGRVSERVLSKAKPTPAAVSHFGMDGAVAHCYVSATASTVTCARATSRCPGERDWWRGAGAPVLELLLDGEAGAAEIRQAEILAGPYDFDFDTNWLESKRFRVLTVPPGLPLGSVLIGSNEEGLRADFEVVERDGVRGLQRTGRPARHPTADLWRQARKEAEALVGRAASSR